MDGSRRGRKCTWERKQPRGLGDDKGSVVKKKIKNFGLKLGPNIWLPNWYIKVMRLGLVKGNVW